MRHLFHNAIVPESLVLESHALWCVLHSQQVPSEPSVCVCEIYQCSGMSPAPGTMQHGPERLKIHQKQKCSNSSAASLCNQMSLGLRRKWVLDAWTSFFVKIPTRM